MSKTGGASPDGARKRGRPPKNRDIPPADLQKVGIGHNTNTTLSDDDIKALTYQNVPGYEAALAAKKSSAAAFLNFCRRIKAEVGPDAVKDIEEIISVRSDEGQKKLRADVERRMRIARWSGMPVGAQASLFEDVDRSTAEDRAQQAGFEAGTQGKSMKIPDELAPSSPAGQAWAKGWHLGQEKIFQIKKLKDDKETPILRSASIGDTAAGDTPKASNGNGEDTAKPKSPRAKKDWGGEPGKAPEPDGATA